MSELYEALTKIEKTNTYYLIDRVIRHILTLPDSIATTERSFLAMKIIKKRKEKRIRI